VDNNYLDLGMNKSGFVDLSIPSPMADLFICPLAQCNKFSLHFTFCLCNRRMYVCIVSGPYEIYITSH
jgi:hypothetical protein